MATTQTNEPAAMAPAHGSATPTQPQAPTAGQASSLADNRGAPAPGFCADRGSRGEAVHWSVIALTVLTAASIVFSAHRPQPRTVDPVLIITETAP
jgi:hypothetical protein